MQRDNPNIAIDRALSQVEGFLHLHHGTACLDEGGESFLLLDCAQAIARLREARDALGITSCPPVTLTPAREVIEGFWPTRDLSRFRGNDPRIHATPNTP
ncbi:MAG: hypothetical protein RJA63_4102 [Pseudomonadota bacterium]